MEQQHQQPHHLHESSSLSSPPRRLSSSSCSTTASAMEAAAPPVLPSTPTILVEHSCSAAVTTPPNAPAAAVSAAAAVVANRRRRRKTTGRKSISNTLSIGGSSNIKGKVDPDDDEEEYGEGESNNNKNAVRSETSRRRRNRRNQHHSAAVFVHRTKEVVWDSNELSIEAALCAVDHWESVYRTVRAVLVQAGITLQRVYGTAKQSAQSLEDGVWRPYRDWIVGPTLSVLERVGTSLAHCHNHPEARRLAQHLLTLTRQVPMVGPHVLAPTLVGTTTALQRTWQTVQYPIPSRDRVRHTVDATLTTIKWGLVQSVTAVQAYLQRVDASLSRIWCHTQWQVLGSGPYITLNPVNQQLVLDHLVERYFSMMPTTSPSMILPEHDDGNKDVTATIAEEQQQQQHNRDSHIRRKNMLARYEWAAHVRWHNPALYADWRERLLSLGYGSTSHDEWWQPHPAFRDVAALLSRKHEEEGEISTNNGPPSPCTIGTPFLVPQPHDDPDGPGTPPQRAPYDDDDDDDGYPTHSDLTASSTACPGLYDTPTALWFVRPSSSSSSSPSGDSSSRWRILTSRGEQRILEERYQQMVQQQCIHVVQERDSGVLWLEEDEETLRDSPLRMGNNAKIRSRNNSNSDYDNEDCCDDSRDGNVDHVDVGPLKEEDSLVLDPSSSDGSKSDSGDDDENDDDIGNAYPEPPDWRPTPPHRRQQIKQPPSPSPKPRQNNLSRTPTIAQWYTPTHHDILVDQQRYAISFFAICPKCRHRHRNHGTSSSRNRHPNRPLATTSTEHSMEDLYGQDCDYCHHHNIRNDPTRRSDRAQSMPHLLPFPPPIAMVMRPTFWRFHGPGDEVRRAIWFLDTPRHGLQPFDEEAHAVLEDAYLFLQWMAYSRRRELVRSTSSSRHANDPQQQEPEFGPKQPDDSDSNNLDASLLTVEVNCPDGTARLVQFSSLTQATAIQKGLGAAIAIFKRRVYRGAWLINRDNPSSSSSRSSPAAVVVDDPNQPAPITMPSFSLDQAIAQAVEENGCLGETMVPNVSLRSLLEPPLSPQPCRSSEVDLLLPSTMMDYDTSLAAPPERLANEDMAKYLRDENNNSKDGSKIDHLCLVVHGIGEMLRSIDVFGMSLQNLSDCCRSMRRNHAQVLDAHFAQMYPHANATVWAQCSTGRVEYLPVEWHESLLILTQRKAAAAPNEPTMHPDSCHRTSHCSENNNNNNTVMMQDISLRTIPNMREFANDTLMDVLFFMSPYHHDIIIDLVTKEMNLVVDKFRRITGFHGSISVIGHSLGSVITWDILNQQIARVPTAATGPWLYNVPTYETSLGMGSGRCTSSQHSEEHSNTPELTTQSTSPSEGRLASYPQLDFCVDNFFLLGSPVPVFLMIRNQRRPLREDFYLRGCRRVFNIFHPYDPVAYRIEPCISPHNSEFEPTIVKHWNGGFRVQYRTRRLWRKLMETTAMTQRNVVEAFEQSMAGMGLLDATVEAGDDEVDDDQPGDSDVTSAFSEPRLSQGGLVTGQLNQGRRIDYMLQEKEIESANEYVAALAAHSSYWLEKDLSLFIARQIYLSTLERSAAEFEVTEQSNWETLTPEGSLYSRS